ncbi:MAG TPA: hypothetical protein VF758_01205 [Candidatus Acidoferrum sp.]
MNEAFERAVVGMSSPDPEVRVVSATEIHHMARAMADHATYPWWAESELSALLGDSNAYVTAGLAVPPGMFQKIREASGSPRLAEVPPDQDAMEFELHLPGGLSMDVLTSRDPAGDGAIARYLRKFGKGIQQVEYRCSDVQRATQILQEKFALSPLYPAPRPGADGTRINFFLVSAPGAAKVLIELYEPAPRLD